MLSLHSHIATWLLSMLANTLFGRVVTAETIVIKADGLVFGPEIITANKGDILEFHFLPSNNSVVKGSFDHPCEPATADTEERFFSGFLPAKSNEENPSIFRVTIGSTAPFPFYCSTPAHCSKGMIGIVNGSPDQLAQYKDQATREAAAQPNGDFPFDKMNPPDPSKPFGGELLKNPDYAAWYGGDSSSSTGTGTATGPQGSDGYGQGAPPPPPPPPPPPTASTPAASTPSAATATYTTTGSGDTTTGAVGGVTGTVVTSTGTLTYTVTSESEMPTASSAPPAANGAVVVGASRGIFGLVAGLVALVL
ncbi:hypothetical protein NEUTE1DRAFT_40103 [Neurospora tetrasperma FGSC 2508]|uniref:Cupredoxin n=1 Tax=Neurospora tetrasperma (strain FGSC 2508 / ATCC MYA-4615 / P0657) TaxID=510951 RepID=F8MJK6_NEUT8|nr:uncharacterized protein NEUTE1DRAFT_40103 [Neurospora tetrasperma FGSC 2508]EGO59997.1 hypothetical protein NEUTE1DRAFT_40103 [Neurospora tetrasperma FGSC 2508]EGZ74148.1 hypothetical protein NEUTE2DRAFT_60520 [Neurospora tetrasperma FGSC 2509]